jgi:monovalent cation/hydrogen antiporter
MASTFIILLAVLISEMVARFIPAVASTYLNILAGVGLGLIPLTNTLIPTFDNDIFMIIFLAPLLYFLKANARLSTSSGSGCQQLSAVPYG